MLYIFFSFGHTKLVQLLVSCCKGFVFSTFGEHICYAVVFWFVVELVAECINGVENIMSSMSLSLNSSSVKLHFCVRVPALVIKSSKDSFGFYRYCRKWTLWILKFPFTLSWLSKNSTSFLVSLPDVQWGHLIFCAQISSGYDADSYGICSYDVCYLTANVPSWLGFVHNFFVLYVLGHFLLEK